MSTAAVAMMVAGAVVILGGLVVCVAITIRHSGKQPQQ